MKKSSSLEKLKQVLNSYDSDELYQCISSYPLVSGFTISDYLANTLVYSLQFIGSVCYIDSKQDSSNDEYYEINDVSNMGLAA
ncbi:MULTISPECIES: hypothetical protein [unclassified Pasteurella]|uniref:hypothetical protein n=1 Tax=unclassified Pasteurella TaxID=2621516 RepID=UPI001073B542|nr:hypothetical protein [Pasteurella sp. 19428wF3_WM03]TFU50847.1 hypothetical protein E4T92_07685 [Pasteurella sp. WM03]